MKVRILTWAVVAALFTPLLTACSDDDDDNESETNSAVAYDSHAVDLGLPSGLKWSDQNLGANAPEGYGNYYAWGETEIKDDYSWDTYKYGDGTVFTKYVPKGSELGKNGFSDDKTVLDRSDDAASVALGGNWRTPTIEEWQELENNCTWTWTAINGINGFRVEGPNGNSIFLPAAGFYRSGILSYANSYGNYWSSSLIPSDADSVNEYYLSPGSRTINSRFRYYGRSIRPVRN